MCVVECYVQSNLLICAYSLRITNVIIYGSIKEEYESKSTGTNSISNSISLQPTPSSLRNQTPQND